MSDREDTNKRSGDVSIDTDENIKVRKPWQKPVVELLQVDKTSGGITNIPESDVGFLS